MRTLEFRAMNTAVILAVEESDRADGSLESARRFVGDCERRFSRFISDSELTHLNKSAGHWCDVSSEMTEMLLLALAYHRETGGLFDPAILPQLKRVGYDRSIDEIRESGAVGASPGHTSVSHGLGEIQIDAKGGRVFIPSTMEIDLGGIAKGWIVERTAELLSASSPACAVSAGGDMLLKGRPASGTPWLVRIENPWDPRREVARFEVGPGAVATSSVVKRSWMQGAILRHHIIDPRTGEPAAGNWVSVTVFAPELMTAEVYAKALLLGGAGETSNLLARRAEISFLAVESDGTVVSSFENVESTYEHKPAIYA